MLGLLLRGFFLFGIISWYSNGVWKFINDYFRNEYKTYLIDEYKRNKHLHPDSDIPTPFPPAAVTEDLKELPSDKVKPFVATDEMEKCDLSHSREELDYHNQLTTNDRECRDDDGFINYWRERKSKEDNSDNNLHCQARETKCEDN